MRFPSTASMWRTLEWKQLNTLWRRANGFHKWIWVCISKSKPFNNSYSSSFCTKYKENIQRQIKTLSAWCANNRPYEFHVHFHFHCFILCLSLLFHLFFSPSNHQNIQLTVRMKNDCFQQRKMHENGKTMSSGYECWYAWKDFETVAHFSHSMLPLGKRMRLRSHRSIWAGEMASLYVKRLI